MGEVLEAVSYVDEADALLHDAIDELGERPSFPKLDGIVFPIVVANADVVAPCPWMAGAEVTLTEALNNYYRPMTEENADTVLSEVIEFITNRVETQEEVVQEAEQAVEDKETETTTRVESQPLQHRDASPPVPVSATDVQKAVVAKSTKPAPAVIQESKSMGVVDTTAERVVDTVDRSTAPMDKEVEIVNEQQPRPLPARPIEVVNEDLTEVPLQENVVKAEKAAEVTDEIEAAVPRVDVPIVEREAEPRGEIIVEVQPGVQSEIEEVVLFVDHSPAEVAVEDNEAKLDFSDEITVQQIEAPNVVPVGEDTEPEHIEFETVVPEPTMIAFEDFAQVDVSEDDVVIDEIAFEDEERIYSLQPELNEPTSVDTELPILEAPEVQNIESFEPIYLPITDIELSGEPNSHGGYLNVSIETSAATFKNKEDEEQPIVAKASSKTFKSSVRAIKKSFTDCVSIGKSVLRLYAAGPSGQYEPIIYQGYVMT
jgi:hypothetical protein